jgi:transposase
MKERIAELAQRLVVGHKREGRCIYDAQAKRELIEYYHQSGESVAKLARDCRVNANLQRTWIRGKERTKVTGATGAVVEISAAPAAFMPVRVGLPAVEVTMSVQARLPNGVVLDLGRVRCSVSTKG